MTKRLVLHCQSPYFNVDNPAFKNKQLENPPKNIGLIVWDNGWIDHHPNKTCVYNDHLGLLDSHHKSLRAWRSTWQNKGPCSWYEDHCMSIRLCTYSIKWLWCHYYLLWVKILSAATRPFCHSVLLLFANPNTTATQDEPREPQNGVPRFHATNFAGVFIRFWENGETEEEHKALNLSKNNSTLYLSIIYYIMQLALLDGYQVVGEVSLPPMAVVLPSKFEQFLMVP